MKKRDVIIIGAGGHGKAVADIVLRCGDNLLGFLDDCPCYPEALYGYPILGKIPDYEKYPDATFLVAIGDAKIRRKIVERMQGVNWYTAIHPAATVSEMGVRIGEGSVVAAGTVISPFAQIGNHCIINTCAVVEHDCWVEDYVHVAVGAKLAGTVTVGQGTMLGMGAMVCNNIHICEDCTIGAGAVVLHSIDENGTYVGVPARKLR